MAEPRSVVTARWLAALLVPFLVLVVVHWSWAPPAISGDYAHYLLHARALVEGRSYSDIGYLYHPATWLIGPPNQPPGLPLTLVPVIALGGIHSALVRLLMVGCVAAFAALAAWRLARDVEPWQAAIGAGLAAYAIEASLASVAPLSDPGFAVLLWATVVLSDREGGWSWGRVAAVTALGIAALSYRMAGITLVPALLLYAVLQRRRLGVRPFVPVMLWSAGGVVALVTRRVRLPVSALLPTTPDDIVEHLSTFVRQYRSGLLDALLYPFAGDIANDIYHVVGGVLALYGLAVILWRVRRSFLGSLIAVYALLLLVAPVAEPRYAWPFYPLIGAGLAVGLTRVTQYVLRSLSPQRRTVVAATLLAALLVLTCVRDMGRPAPPSLVRHPDARALFAWLVQRAHTTADSARLAYYNPRVLTLETRIPAMGLAPRTPPGQMAVLADLRATHFIWQGTGLGDSTSRPPCVQRAANRLPELYPDRFTLVYRNATFRVYRVTPGDARQYSVGESISWSEC